jgi:hypothetical protein
MKTKIKEINSEIENRIEMEIVVDAYNESERAMGWYYYLQDNLSVPFKAECILLVSTSPLKLGEIFEVIGMASEEICEYDMFVTIKWKNGETLCVPLKQLKGVNVDETTAQALNDWSYWISQGYSF